MKFRVCVEVSGLKAQDSWLLGKCFGYKGLGFRAVQGYRVHGIGGFLWCDFRQIQGIIIDHRRSPSKKL